MNSLSFTRNVSIKLFPWINSKMSWCSLMSRIMKTKTMSLISKLLKNNKANILITDQIWTSCILSLSKILIFLENFKRLINKRYNKMKKYCLMKMRTAFINCATLLLTGLELTPILGIIIYLKKLKRKNQLDLMITISLNYIM